MKTIRFIATLLLLSWCLVGFPLLMASCVSNHSTEYEKPRKTEVVTLRFKIGDIVYLKPDSVRAVIENVNHCGCGKHSYQLYYFNKNGDKITEGEFKDELIY